MELLFANLHPADAQLNSRDPESSVGILIFAAATLILLGLTLYSCDLPFTRKSTFIKSLR